MAASCTSHGAVINLVQTSKGVGLFEWIGLGINYAQTKNYNVMYATIFLSQFKDAFAKEQLFSTAKSYRNELHLSVQGNLLMIAADNKEDLDNKLLLLAEASSIDFSYKVTYKPTLLPEYINTYSKHGIVANF